MVLGGRAEQGQGRASLAGGLGLTQCQSQRDTSPLPSALEIGSETPFL